MSSHLTSEQEEISGIFFSNPFTKKKIEEESTDFSSLLKYFEELRDVAQTLNKSYKDLTQSKKKKKVFGNTVFQWDLVLLYNVENNIKTAKNVMNKFEDYTSICSEVAPFNSTCYRVQARVVEFIDSTNKTIGDIQENIKSFYKDEGYNTEYLFLPGGWTEVKDEKTGLLYVFNENNPEQKFYTEGFQVDI